MKRKLQFILGLIALLLAFAPVALALEVDYPNIPGAPPIICNARDCTSLSQYIQYVFIFIILSAGALGIIAIVWSGFQILMSFGSPVARGAANERIRNALLGIVLLMSSFIILRTVNPNFITPRLGIANLQPGIYFRNPHAPSSDDPQPFTYKQAPDFSNDTSQEPSDTELYYFCTAPGRDLLVWTYGLPDMVPDGTETTHILKCGDSLRVAGSVLSFERKYRDNGVYYYETPDCTGYSSDVQKSSGSIPYYRQVKSMKIFSGLLGDERYGVILGKESGGLTEGECGEPWVKAQPGESECIAIENDLSDNEFNPFYAYIIKYNPNYTDYGSASSSVKLYSENLVAELKQDGDIGGLFIYDLNPNDGNPDAVINAKGTTFTEGAPRTECCTDANNDEDSPYFNELCAGETDPKTDPFSSDYENNNCIKGIQPNGAYYTFLYSRNDRSGDRMCEDFLNTWDDLPTQAPELFNNNKTIYKIVIIPRS